LTKLTTKSLLIKISKNP